jgi:hypothetical protein
MQNDDFMSCINIETLIEREGDGIIIERRVRRGVVHRNRGVCESCDKFLYISNAQGACERRAKCRAIPEKG